MTNAEIHALVRLSASLAGGDGSLLREAMEACLHQADPGRTEEVILQSYLFLGYPATLNAFGLWREVSGTDAGEPTSEGWGEWRHRGEEVCRTVYGGQYEGLRSNVRALHPDMERWMVVEGYGKVLGRPGLALSVRELCIAALLAVFGAPRQLHSHLRGALNCGAGIDQVEVALEVAEDFLGAEGVEGNRAIWGRVRERWLRATAEGKKGTGRAGEAPVAPES